MFSYPEACRHLEFDLQFPNPACLAAGASIDTRTLEIGEMFVAIKGQLTDGHRFVSEAFRKGASGAVISRESAADLLSELSAQSRPPQNLIIVEDTRAALSKIAAWYRSRFRISVIGITGSVGKTSVKEFLTFLLRRKFPAIASPGNYNNDLGLPLTILKIHPSDRCCIAEMGANHAGEIRSLTQILRPTAAAITRIAPAHLEGFKSVQGIYDAKLEILEGLLHEGPFVIPSDDPQLYQRACESDCRPIRVGKENHADWVVSNVSRIEDRVHFTLNGGRRFAFPSHARFMAQNAAMAVALADAVGLPVEDLPEFWDDFVLPAGRFQPQALPNGLCVVHDGYNANPGSFEKAFEAFQEMDCPFGARKYVVMGDMLELGEQEAEYHRQTGELLANYFFDGVFAYGKRTRDTIESVAAKAPHMSSGHYETLDDVFTALKRVLRKNDMILLKGSRGVRVESIIESLRSLHIPKLSAPNT